MASAKTMLVLCLFASATTVCGNTAPSSPCAFDDDACIKATELADEIDSGLVLLQRQASVTKLAVKKPETVLKQLKETTVIKQIENKTIANVISQMKTEMKVHKADANSTASTTANPLGWGGAMFFNVDTMDWYQLIIITGIYGYILYVGSNMIGDGAEQLMVFPSVKGIVGSVIVPFLGAVPDSMMVMFSGFGPDAQTQVSTGVGALAGSTVMLLTFPWMVVNMAGSVPCAKDGTADYKRSGDTSNIGFFNSAVTYKNSINANVKMMVLTSLSFLIIQIPAFFMDRSGIPVAQQAAAENTWALIGLIVSLALFFGYMYYMYANSKAEDSAVHQKHLSVIKDQVKKGQLGLSAILENLSSGDGDLSDEKGFREIIRTFFHRYDTSGDANLQECEFNYCIQDLGYRLSKEEVTKQFKGALTGAKGPNAEMNFEQFVAWAKKFRTKEYEKVKATVVKMPSYGDEEDDEEEEIPEDIQHLSPEEQTKALLVRSFWNMGAGTALVLLFSDPAVNVFTEWGVRLGVSSFYVSFLLAPFASNASELLVAYGMALKKTSSSVTTSFESLVGAACMNNTLCLAVFFALVYFETLAWKFKAETLGILVIQWIMAAIIMSGTTQRKFMGLVILSLYPLCLLIVYVMENVFGWD